MILYKVDDVQVSHSWRDRVGSFDFNRREECSLQIVFQMKRAYNSFDLDYKYSIVWNELYNGQIALIWVALKEEPYENDCS